MFLRSQRFIIVHKAEKSNKKLLEIQYPTWKTSQFLQIAEFLYFLSHFQEIKPIFDNRYQISFNL